MIRRLVRLMLVLGAFFVGNFAMFLFLGYFVFGFFDTTGSSAAADRPTTQDWFDVLTTLAGFAVAGLVWIATKSLTRQTEKETEEG